MTDQGGPDCDCEVCKLNRQEEAAAKARARGLEARLQDLEARVAELERASIKTWCQECGGTGGLEGAPCVECGK